MYVDTAKHGEHNQHTMDKRTTSRSASARKPAFGWSARFDSWRCQRSSSVWHRSGIFGQSTTRNRGFRLILCR